MSKFYRTLDGAIEQVSAWRSEDSSIVFTNGCFDILHPGHIHCLQQAKSMGDYLVVGLNSDDSVRRLKGEARPYHDQNQRAMQLMALSCVDVVVLFSEDTPKEVIYSLKPDILVKGGDYTEKEVVGGDYVRSLGGRVEIIDLLQGHSTTKILNFVHSQKKGNHDI
jgi:D-beta-D-heptose 7-phosphate kinase/D-beta-D-heptose 1-phosphate adenosyltransferase